MHHDMYQGYESAASGYSPGGCITKCIEEIITRSDVSGDVPG